MGRLALIGGRGFEALSPWRSARPLQAAAGNVLDAGAYVVLARHGISSYCPPHRIDHAANLRSLLEAGCDRALAICSVGGLRDSVGVGTFLCPDQFIALHGTSTAFDDERGHVVPGFDGELRQAAIATWRERGGPPLLDGGTYWETRGPRFETEAEVRLIAAHADVVGMTMASEAVNAGQLGLRYAAVCVVDNLANGVREEPLTVEEYEAGVAANRSTLAETLGAMVPRLLETVA
jgi:5'-methylthioadenosine phosphorylase